MSYSEYLNRQKINSVKVIDLQMRFPDASSFTWRTKLAATSVNDRSKHVINNTFDPSVSPITYAKSGGSYPGTGFGGKVQDASSFTLSTSATAIGVDNFSLTKRETICPNVRSPASQVVSEVLGNADGANQRVTVADLSNCGVSRNTVTNNNWKMSVGSYIDTTYMRQTPGAGTSTCHINRRASRPSQFVDICPDIKTGKVTTIGTTRNGTTNTSGAVKVDNGSLFGEEIPKAVIRIAEPSVPYSPVKAAFITAATGPQVGGGDTPGSRASKVGGPTPLVKHSISQRGWGGYNFSKKNIGNTEPKAPR
jgi:hypothetical protein